MSSSYCLKMQKNNHTESKEPRVTETGNSVVCDSKKKMKKKRSQ